jgi:hypothetical protein
MAAIPHRQASDVRTVNVPARRDVMAHKDYFVTTACGQEMPSTLVTRDDARVRCSCCKEGRPWPAGAGT